MIAKCRPKIVGQTTVIADASAMVLVPTPGHGHRLVHRMHDLGDGDAVDASGKRIAAARTANRLDQPRPAQLEEKLLQLGQRNHLAFGNCRQRNTHLGVVFRQVCDRAHGVRSLGT